MLRLASLLFQVNDSESKHMEARYPHRRRS